MRKKHRIRRLLIFLATMAIVLTGVSGVAKNPVNTAVNAVKAAYYYHRYSGLQSNSMLPPSQSQAEEVLTPSVKDQLGKSIKWNGSGAFIINDDRAKLKANISSAPYAVNRNDSEGRAHVGDAWLNRTTRQYQNRNNTGNGASQWRPAGYQQKMNLTNGPRRAYDRGHLLGYALVGGIRSFDASESNPNNIATQTAWANEARSTSSTGQNYYEGIVRQALDQGKQVRYRVVDIYRNKTDELPVGAHIQAKSSDGSINFNVFVPNVQRNISINYATGAVTQR